MNVRRTRSLQDPPNLTPKEIKKCKHVSDIAKLFDIPGNITEVNILKVGHINNTYMSIWNHEPSDYSDVGSSRYIHQCINKRIFLDVPNMMRNIEKVLKILAAKVRPDLGEESVQLIRTKLGAAFVQDQAGEYWRTYAFVPDSQSFNVCPSQRHAYEAGQQSGRFITRLKDFNPRDCGDVIPHFHDSLRRYQALGQAVKEDSLGRVKHVNPELEFAFKQKHSAGLLINAVSQRTVPLRVIHSDMKLNNVLFSTVTDAALCVVDLDTCMSFTPAYDYGDMMRSLAFDVDEDEPDLEKVIVNQEYLQAATTGFMQEMSGILTKEEKQLLPPAPRIIALTLGVRFLTDYLAGDNYFKINYPEHNLQRTRTQFAVARELSRCETTLHSLVGSQPMVEAVRKVAAD